VLQRLLRFSPEGSPQRHLEELMEQLGGMGLPEEHAHPLGVLLGLPVPEGASVYRLTHERRREKTHEALADLLLGLARRRPMLVAVEDMHWADSSWLEFLGSLLERLEGVPLLVVLSARPEFQPPWPSRSWFHPLTLERLPAQLAASLVKEAARGVPLPEETVRTLVEKTDGIPLFIEEMTRTVLEGGAVASIPVTLQELLLARLDLLPSRRKALAQLGAVVGRDFSLALLAAVMGREDSDELRRELAGLVEAGLLEEEREENGGPGYQFRHALFQEAAYQSLSRGERRQHHRRIAQVLVERFPETVEARPEVLAHHYTEAGELERALSYWQKAGMLAVQHMAMPEAVSHLTRALELLRTLPEAQRRPGAERWVLTTLGFSQALLWGYDSPEVARTFTQARELEPLLRMDVAPRELEDACWSHFTYHEARAEFLQCHELAGWLRREGERQRSPLLLAAGDCMRALVSAYEGHARSAQESIERAVASARANGEPQGELLLAPVLSFASAIHSVSGQCARAREDDREALELIRRGEAPFIVRMVMTYMALACQSRREVTTALRYADEVLAISSERGPWLWPAWARVIRGWALVELARPQEGLALLRQELARWREQRILGGRTYGLGMLAEAHLRLGQVPEGLSVVQEALGLTRVTGEHGNEAELHRLRGELLCVGGRKAEARQDFLRAIALAREQGALLYELRAVVALGRLLGDTGRPEAVRLGPRLMAPAPGVMRH
jgi:tetratricopeptide (TPR) repeat protein